MATEVLQPQNLLVEKFRVHTTSFHCRRTLPATGSLAVKRRQHGRPSPKHDKRKISAAAEAKKSSRGGVRRKDETAGRHPVMGQVTLMRRGESLSSIVPKTRGGSPPKTRGGSPKSSESQKIVQKKIRLAAAPPPVAADIYAGTAFISSPSPRSVPLPSFFNKKDDPNSFEDGATRFLRHILRLE